MIVAAAKAGSNKAGALELGAGALGTESKKTAAEPPQASRDRDMGHDIDIQIVKDGSDDDLPAGWSTAVDPSSGRTYFYSESGETSWEKPVPVPVKAAAPLADMDLGDLVDVQGVEETGDIDEETGVVDSNRVMIRGHSFSTNKPSRRSTINVFGAAAQEQQEQEEEAAAASGGKGARAQAPPNDSTRALALARKRSSMSAVNL